MPAPQCLILARMFYSMLACSRDVGRVGRCEFLAPGNFPGRGTMANSNLDAPLYTLSNTVGNGQRADGAGPQATRQDSTLQYGDHLARTGECLHLLLHALGVDAVARISQHFADRIADGFGRAHRW